MFNTFVLETRTGFLRKTFVLETRKGFLRKTFVLETRKGFLRKTVAVSHFLMTGFTIPSSIHKTLSKITNIVFICQMSIHLTFNYFQCSKPEILT